MYNSWKYLPIEILINMSANYYYTVVKHALLNMLTLKFYLINIIQTLVRPTISTQNISYNIYRE